MQMQCWNDHKPHWAIVHEAYTVLGTWTPAITHVGLICLPCKVLPVWSWASSRSKVIIKDINLQRLGSSTRLFSTALHDWAGAKVNAESMFLTPQQAVHSTHKGHRMTGKVIGLSLVFSVLLLWTFRCIICQLLNMGFFGSKCMLSNK